MFWLTVYHPRFVLPIYVVLMLNSDESVLRLDHNNLARLNGFQGS